jgi:hypothetical protein
MHQVLGQTIFPKYLCEKQVKMNNNDEREGKELYVMTLPVLDMHRSFYSFVYSSSFHELGFFI